MSAEQLESFNPATGELVGAVPTLPLAEVSQVVAAARTAGNSWAGLSLEARKEAMLPAGERLRSKEKELATLLTSEMGKPFPEALGEVKRASRTYEGYIEEIVSALQDEKLIDKYVETTVQYVPFGVCLAISPWNFPLYMPHWMVVPALMAGNSVILKPSEETPLIAQAYIEVLREGLPENVVQVVHGNEEQGKALVQADVDLIAFTGSREAGKHIMAAASGGLKRVILELGGKDPLIVLDDADLEAAAKFASNNAFRNAGQVCVSTERIYVDRSVADEFQGLLRKYTESHIVGDGSEEGTTVGPMINERQRAHVVAQVEAAVKDGAKVIGEPKQYGERFVAPTIVADVTHDMDLMRTETFGPVVGVMPFDSIDEAVELANDSPFGLGASVYGKDEERAWKVASQIDAGMVGVNQSLYGASGAPWVGAKESGIGFHSGIAGHRQFAQTKTLSRPLKKAS